MTDRETLYGDAVQEEMDRVYGKEETNAERDLRLFVAEGGGHYDRADYEGCSICKRILGEKQAAVQAERVGLVQKAILNDITAEAAFATTWTDSPRADKLDGARVVPKADKLRADLIPWDVVDYVVDRKEDETDVGRALNDIFYRDEVPVIKLTPETLRGAVGAFALGARKYGERSWEKGFSFKAIYGAGKRHLLAEEPYDIETGASHYFNEVANLLILARFVRNLDRYAAFDDRPRPFLEQQ